MDKTNCLTLVCTCMYEVADVVHQRGELLLLKYSACMLNVHMLSRVDGVNCLMILQIPQTTKFKCVNFNFGTVFQFSLHSFDYTV